MNGVYVFGAQSQACGDDKVFQNISIELMTRAEAVLRKGSVRAEKSGRPGTEPGAWPAFKQLVEEEEAVNEKEPERFKEQQSSAVPQEQQEWAFFRGELAKFLRQI